MGTRRGARRTRDVRRSAAPILDGYPGRRRGRSAFFSAPLMAGRRRVDLVLVERGLCATRAEAQRLLLAGKVFAAGQRVEKPGTLVPAEAPLSVAGPDHPFVSRGGVKLRHARQAFRVEPRDRVCLDVGASAGGFTDCLLQS